MGPAKLTQGVTGAPPHRPRRAQDLKFMPQRPVQWFAPSVLADAGLRVLISSAFGAFLDKRELQESVATAPLVHRVDAEETWFDFIADTGDGFDPTYTVAWLAGRPELALAGAATPLPRGDLLLLGGDEVYPVGNPEAYESRFWRPFEASLPWLATGNPDLYVVPGNHDWYDGLTSFFRVFCQGNWIGGRRTRQTRSYFAIQLPHRWWIWGIDIQLDSYIDEPQQDYFRAADLQKGDRIVLCTASPSWYDGPTAQSFRNLQFVERTLIAPRGGRLVLSLSGDSHHYAHYVGEDGTHKVTAGGGGAFLHPTHTLSDDPLELPVAASEQIQAFAPAACYPDQRTSRRLAWGAVALPWRNPTFAVVPAAVYLVLGWASQFGLRALGPAGDIDDVALAAGWFDLMLGLARNPISVLLVLVMLAGAVGFAKPPARLAERWQLPARVAMGALHLGLHLLALVAVGLLSVRLASLAFDRGFWFNALLVVLMAGLGGLVGGAVTGLYLGVTCALSGAHGNEAFSAMRLTGYKNFLRLHLGPDGSLTVYPIGIRRAHARWRPDPDNPDPQAAWLAPEGPAPVAHLIEKPFPVDRRG